MAISNPSFGELLLARSDLSFLRKEKQHDSLFKNVFNSIEPTQDRSLFEASFISTLESFGYNADQADKIADILLPDILTYDYSSSAGFLNGRKLTDDVIDIELALVTNGKVTTDKVGPHTDYLSTFPYLGNPH